jgi:16S rRNA (cytidine1402-2'-O)-methyltransferase
MAGVLHVVATPLGNLGDWTRRAQEVLGAADLVLAEDTRHTRRLLTHFGIRAPLESYHDFSESGRVHQILERLRSGLKVALVSDRGTPTISDPGYRLVRLCRENDIPVLPIPGPSAIVAALSVSGLPTDAFRFVGFLPSRREARRRKLEALRAGRETLVFFEAPHRLDECLEDLSDILGDRVAFLAREMTKVHEEYLYGSVADIRAAVEAKGEVVIILEGAGASLSGGDEAAPDLGAMSRQELLKLIARRLGVPRRALYDALFKKEGAR